MPDVLSVQVAAEEKKCSHQTIYNALDRGALNELRTGTTRLVVRDETYEQFEVSRKNDPRRNPLPTDHGRENIAQ